MHVGERNGPVDEVRLGVRHWPRARAQPAGFAALLDVMTIRAAIDAYSLLNHHMLPGERSDFQENSGYLPATTGSADDAISAQVRHRHGSRRHRASRARVLWRWRLWLWMRTMMLISARSDKVRSTGTSFIAAFTRWASPAAA